MHTALSARARHTGIIDMAALRLPWMGCTAGRRIANESDVSDLWQTILDIRRTRRAYMGAIDGTDDPALSQSLKPLSDFTNDIDPPPPADIRSPEERNRSAITAWENWRDRIYAVHPMAVRFIIEVVVLDHDMRADIPLAYVLREVAR
jgi:hypothetical protein